MSFTRAELERIVGGKVEVRGGIAHVIRPGAVSTPSELRTAPRIAYKSKWEARYAGYLSVQCSAPATAGFARWFGYETMKLKVASTVTSDGLKRSSWYVPDFTVIRDGRLQVDEVKGHWREAARVKIKVIADQYPWLPIRIVAFDGATPTLLEMYNS